MAWMSVRNLAGTSVFLELGTESEDLIWLGILDTMGSVIRILLIGLILFLALTVFSCAAADTLAISVMETVEGIIIENTGDSDCIIFVSWADNQQQFDLAVGETRVITDTPKPSNISAVMK